jgi:glycosyltransferase involved in cell wall biosynthesis
MSHLALLAPPWIPIPPPGYGGIEQVVRLLAAGLVDAGHRVTLFAAPGSRSPAEVRTPLSEPHPDEIQFSMWEVDHVARSFDAIDAAADDGDPFHAVHDHTGFAALAMASRLQTPLVHTLHGPFEPDLFEFYACHGRKGQLVAISAAQRAAAPEHLRDDIAVVHNPLAVEEWPFSEDTDGYVLWIARINDDKGPQRAIAAARAAGVGLVLAGPVHPGQEEFFAREVEPLIDDDAVRYVGEVGEDGKRELYTGARALLMPIRWAEPFGMVMVEAMACGTPVIAFPEGSAPEVVIDSETGFLVDDEDAMAQAIGRIGEIDRRRCRQSVSERFGVASVVARYEAVYERARERDGRFSRRRTPSVPPRQSRRSEARELGLR